MNNLQSAQRALKPKKVIASIDFQITTQKHVELELEQKQNAGMTQTTMDALDNYVRNNYQIAPGSIPNIINIQYKDK